MIFLGFVASIISISTQVWANMTVEQSGKAEHTIYLTYSFDTCPIFARLRSSDNYHAKVSINSEYYRHLIRFWHHGRGEVIGKFGSFFWTLLFQKQTRLYKKTQIESSHGTIVPRNWAELGGTKWN